MTEPNLVLFHGWRSSASRRVRLCLAEKGLHYESRIIDMLRGDQHTPEYLAMNPNGVVPALLHDGRVLYESSVIAEYLEECFPDHSIRPADPYERHTMRNFVRWVDENCLPNLIVFNWSQSMQPAASQWTDEQLKERLARIPTQARRDAWTRVARQPYTDDEKSAAMTKLLKLLNRMDSMLEGRHWLVGDAYSIADIGALPFVVRIEELNPAALAQHPRVVDWFARAKARPSFAAAHIEAWDAR